MTKERKEEIIKELRQIWQELNDDDDRFLIWRTGSGITRAINDLQNEK